MGYPGGYRQKKGAMGPWLSHWVWYDGRHENEIYEAKSDGSQDR
jgi:hypothetical protein